MDLRATWNSRQRSVAMGASAFVALYVPFGPIRIGSPAPPCGVTDDGMEICALVMHPEQLLSSTGLTLEWALVPIIGSLAVFALSELQRRRAARCDHVAPEAPLSAAPHPL